jgi:hypothetical protein
LETVRFEKYKPVAGAAGLIHGLVFRRVQQTEENGELRLPPSRQHQPSPFQSSLQSGIYKSNKMNTNNIFKFVLFMLSSQVAHGCVILFNF